MAADVPLLSSYKRGFVGRRVFHTLTGFKPHPGNQPFFIPIIQIFLWCLPGTVALLSAQNEEYGPYIGGVCVFTLGLLLHVVQCTVVLIKGRIVSTAADENGGGVGGMLDEEDESGGGRSWMTRLIPGKIFKINYLIHPIVAGGVTILSCTVLNLFIIAQDIGYINGSVVYALCWISFNIGVQPLLITPTPETATFRHVDTYDLNVYSRPLHLVLLQVCIYIGLYLGNLPVFVLVCYSVHSALTLLWILGILPGIEPLLLWISEQTLVFVFGGSKTSSVRKLILSFLLSTLQVTAVCLISKDLHTVILISAYSGYILSSHLLGIFSFFKEIHQKGTKVGASQTIVAGQPTEAGQPTGAGQTTEAGQPTGAGQATEAGQPTGAGQTTEAGQITAGSPVAGQSIVYPDMKYEKPGVGLRFLGSPRWIHFIQSILSHLSNIILLTLLITLVENNLTLQQKQDGGNWVGWILVGYTAVLFLYLELNKVYSFCGALRSPIYTLRRPAGFTPINYLFSLLHPSLGALLSILFAILTASGDTKTISRLSGEFGISFLLEVLSVLRVLRWSWQSTVSVLLEISAYQIIAFILDRSNFNPGVGWELSNLQVLMLISLCRDRLGQIVDKLFFFLVLTATSMEDRASRRPYAIILFQLNLIFFPFVFVLILISSLLSAPLLPLFSLPVYFLTFPRPSSFWPAAAGEASVFSDDSLYYQQCSRSTLSSLEKAARFGNLGNLQPQDILLLRHEDRIMWALVGEVGNRFISLNLRGMELQETSCHSLEATRIDDIFDSAFEKKTLMNRFMFHTLTPLNTLEVNMYSDTKNVLTGVINTKETLQVVAESFLECFLWFVVEHVYQENKDGGEKKGKREEDEKGRRGDTAVVSFDEEAPESGEGLNLVDQVNLSASIEQVNLDSWPDSDENLPWATRNPAGNQRLGSVRISRYLQHQDSSSSIFKDLEQDEVQDFQEIRINHRVPELENQLIQPDKTESLLPGLLDPIRPSSSTLGWKPLQKTILTPAKLRANLRPESLRFELPDHWFDRIKDSEPDQGWFPSRFYTHCIQVKDSAAAEDSILLRQYKILTQYIFNKIYGVGGSPSNAYLQGPNHVFKHFKDFSSSTLSSDLRDITHQAYRAAVKLALDKVLLGDMEQDEIITNLSELKKNWFLGMETDPRWKESIVTEVPNLFSLQINEGRETGQTVFKSHILNLRTCQVKVGRLKGEVVRGLWSSLSLELLYLTNDDEERYSIQADERLLRNLTVQAANPPLGYSIFNSGTTTFSR